MINTSILNPSSICIIGGSNDIKKPGGKVVKNIIDGNYKGNLYVVNKRENTVQGIPCFSSVDELEKVDLAIISIPANHCLEVIKTLAHKKNTKAFIILSAGFGEAGQQGQQWEREIVEVVNSVNGCLIGPNCIGVLTQNYNGVFTSPIPKLDNDGCDLISSSGATAVFLMEAGIPLGLKFSNVFSVGNSAQIGVEDVLEYMDIHFDYEKDSKIKLLYLESVNNPKKLLKHASSLINKGARIAAIKAGSTEAGSRAAASHTGALTSSDMIVRSLFKKAGIVYCSSREELLSVASIFHYKKLLGKNIAVITHAGGSAVMLTDTLSTGGLEVPPITGKNADNLLSYLYSGSSVKNPVDFLATGTAEQLGIIIDYCEHKFDHIDAMVVVFGSPGLFDVENVYNVLSVKLDVCNKPIYPVLPSVINAQKEIQKFLSKGHINFPDEVVLGRALAAIYNTSEPSLPNQKKAIQNNKIRSIIDNANDGFLSPSEVSEILDEIEISRVHEFEVSSYQQMKDLKIEFPVVMKVVGPIHKSDLGGVILNVNSLEQAESHFSNLMSIENATGVLIQPMIEGIELFAGVKRETNFGHLVLCGLGGVFIEILNDFSSCLAPVSTSEASSMIKNLKGYKIIEGTRGMQGIDQKQYADIICKLSKLVEIAPEISELDINPMMASKSKIIAVDTRICIEK